MAARSPADPHRDHDPRRFEAHGGAMEDLGERRHEELPRAVVRTLGAALRIEQGQALSASVLVDSRNPREIQRREALAQRVELLAPLRVRGACQHLERHRETDHYAMNVASPTSQSTSPEISFSRAWIAARESPAPSCSKGVESTV